jgi:hypothetical protein
MHAPLPGLILRRIARIRFERRAVGDRLTPGDEYFSRIPFRHHDRIGRRDRHTFEPEHGPLASTSFSSRVYVFRILGLLGYCRDSIQERFDASERRGCRRRETAGQETASRPSRVHNVLEMFIAGCVARTFIIDDRHKKSPFAETQ